jgi:outer membrane biosynthesis protein TonB
VTRRPRAPGNPLLALLGTLVVHAVAGVFLFAAAAEREITPPTYAVRLVAAPAPDMEPRKAPDVVERPAETPPAPAPTPQRSPKSTVSRAVPPPELDDTKREAAPRTTPDVTPLPGEKPSTGSDIVTVSTVGVEFPFPEYLQNMMSEILRRWVQPSGPTMLQAEVSFIVHRDGSISALQLVRRSGSFSFDLEARGAVEEAGRLKAFGPLPDDWAEDVLFVRFFFAPQRRH